MGNSGSMHNMAGLDEHLRHTSTMSAAQHQHQHQQKQFQDHLLQSSSNQIEWSGARPARQPQVKVLPTLIDSSARHLRPTNNGNILHNGGTLSGRKESIVRSRSAHPTVVPPQPAKRLHPKLMQRSQTQLQLIRDDDYDDRRPSTSATLPSFKRFDSEPDLRGSATDEINDVPVKPTLTRSAAVGGGGKKKKAAAPPPPIARAVVATSKGADAYDPERFGWRTTAKLPAEAEVTPRKLRLFKTKAESRKLSNVPIGTSTKINTEASDHYFQRTAVALDSVEPTHRRSSDEKQFKSLPSYQHQQQQHNHQQSQRVPVSSDFDRLSDGSIWPEDRVRVLPPNGHQFRREKSFDITLLRSQEAIRTRNEPTPRYEYQSPDLIPVPPPPPAQSRQTVAIDKTKLHRKGSHQLDRTAPDDSHFKRELLEATRRRSINVTNITSESTTTDYDPKAAAVPSFDRTIPRVRHLQTNKDAIHEAVPPVAVQPMAKKFYFGMEKDDDENESRTSGIDQDAQRIQTETIDKFAASLMDADRSGVRKSNGSSVSSESAISYGVDDNDCLADADQDALPTASSIQVHMRPTLPRRQFEIPRFSPAAAWRTLNEDVIIAPTTRIIPTAYSSYETQSNDTVSAIQSAPPPPPAPSTSQEHRIERHYREPPAFGDNKSGDSGISGDAALPCDSPKGARAAETCTVTADESLLGPFLSTWTPQQDLVDDDSSGDEANDDVSVDSDTIAAKLTETPSPTDDDLTKYSNRGHIFSLSLPRDAHLANYNDTALHVAATVPTAAAVTFNSLQKLKRTVSGAFGGGGGGQPPPSSYRSDNWVLSRSAPTSIDSQFSEVPPDTVDGVTVSTGESSAVAPTSYHRRRPRQQEMGATTTIQPPSFNYLTSGKHVMYLPDDEKNGHVAAPASTDHSYTRKVDTRSRLMDTDASAHVQRQRQSLQDPPESSVSMQLQSVQTPHLKLSKNRSGTGAGNGNNNSNTSGHHRFTFQSTVRQIERRRLAERLSKEAEHKEAQRLSELEAMRRVEEEFQRKRASEKASIRQQLRLYSIEAAAAATSTSEEHSGNYNSLPIEWQTSRAEPDGAVSSPTPSPTSATQQEYIDTKTPYIQRLIDQKCGSPKTRYAIDKSEVHTSDYRAVRRDYTSYGNIETNDDTKKYSRVQQATYLYDDDEFVMADNYRKSFANGRSICSSE